MPKRTRQTIVSSPLHRDPETDGNDYGACGKHKKKANKAIAALVDEICDRIEGQGITDGDDLVECLRSGLERICDKYEDAGVTDTIVKENVRNAIALTAEEAEIEVDWDGIYGW